MCTKPNVGTLERAVLEKLTQLPGGVTFLDFPQELGMTDEKLEEVIGNLRTGMYPSEQDGELRLDS
jgi:hypothetical protein